ncbi:FAD-dependent oxidoreductase [Thalassospira marina]|uniref:Flavin-dependent monooxygenase n=1 Tax=Thalassospira marina TaxID=2048283 RepID=A0A2N3KRS4_9PROT|nr:NAD(P)/FAD-dependent oxidoreductase [Thalassospira marina]PKR53254.1 salicylate hydroxylase [Thalassospira marina]
MTEKPGIAIIGGGPGGLMLARLLHMAGFAATVFERDESAQFRPQGGTLDIHENTGQQALAQAGLLSAFKRFARYDDQGGRLCDKHGRLLLDDPGQPEDNRPEIDRTALRDLLLASLPKGMVRWGQAVASISPTKEGAFRVHTQNGPVADYDLVIGADGAWSRVRPLLSAYQPHYSGLTFIEFGIDDVDASHPEIAGFVGRGKLGAEGDGRAIIIQRNANAHLRGYAIFRVPENWASEQFANLSPAARRERLVAEFPGWSPRLTDMIRVANDHIVPRLIYALPVGHHWQNRPGLTLLGDAAHVMSPFGGNGVNEALFDAAELARHIVSADDWRDGVKTYETEMFARVSLPAREAHDAAATELSHLGLELTQAVMESHRAEAALT